MPTKHILSAIVLLAGALCMFATSEPNDLGDPPSPAFQPWPTNPSTADLRDLPALRLTEGGTPRAFQLTLEGASLDSKIYVTTEFQVSASAIDGIAELVITDFDCETGEAASETRQLLSNGETVTGALITHVVDTNVQNYRWSDEFCFEFASEQGEIRLFWRGSVGSGSHNQTVLTATVDTYPE